MFLEGKSPAYIARYLTESGIPTPGGKPNWRPNTVESILTNEKYKGDAILQKTFCTDFLTKKTKVNEGEVPQYYVEGSHPAIIEPEIFDAVQIELKRRKQQGRRNYTPHCFSGRIYCDECGALYGSKMWHSHTVWKCNAKHKQLAACSTPALRNETIQDAFVRAFNQVIDRKDVIIQICEDTLRERCDTSGLAERLAELRTELEIITGLMQRHISVNAHVAIDQGEYQRQYDEYEARYNEAQRRIAEAEARREALTAKRGKLMGYLDLLSKQGTIRTFNETLWCGAVEQVRIKEDGTMRFIFKDGAVVEG